MSPNSPKIAPPEPTEFVKPNLWTDNMAGSNMRSVEMKQSNVKHQNHDESLSTMRTSEKLTMMTKSFIGNTMPQILGNSAFISVIWISFYLFFVAILTLQAVLTFKDYYSHPVNVEVTIETGSNSLEFPAVTICNNNIVKKSSISRIPKYNELASLSDYVYQEILPPSNRNYAALASLGLYQCDYDNNWIPGSWVCNGRTDCMHGSDENPDICPEYPSFNYTNNCLDSYLQCPEEKTCASVCDGVRDCVVVPGYDESEEFGCTSNSGNFTFTADLIPKTLTSPNYPNSYMNNLDKYYFIEAAENHVIKIVFDMFAVELCEENLCWCDALTIQEGTPDEALSFFTFNGTARMCGQMCNFGDIVSQSNKLTVWFSTDASLTTRGWSFTYEAVPEDQIQENTGYEITSSTSCDYDFVGGGTDGMGEGTNGRPDQGTSETYESEYYNTEPPSYTEYFEEQPNQNHQASPQPQPPISHEFSQFNDIDMYDWYSVYKNSKMPDFSDFRKFTKFTQDELVGNGHQKEDFIVQCVFDGEVCDITWFHKFQHVSYGNCFSFNSVINAQGKSQYLGEARYTSKVGSENGLALSLFLEADEYLGVMGHKTGVRVVLHNSDEYPPLLTKGMQVNAGSATTISIRQQTVLRRSDPFSDCAETWPDFLELNSIYKKYRYTLEFCKYLCYQKTLAEVCGCADTFDWNFTDNSDIQEKAKSNCDVWNNVDYNCLTSVFDEFNEGQRSCGCPNSCSDKSYRSTLSSALWPSAAYTAHFISLMKKSNSSKVRKFINTALSQAYNDEWAKSILQERVEDNFARVEISFETLVYQRIKESPKYNLSTLFGTIGGNLGLWLGWSILSVLEFLQWIGMTIGLFFMGRRKKKNNQVGDANKQETPYL